MNEDIGNGEDHAYTYKLLAEHQKGNLCYFLSMSSDMYCIDRTTEGSAQKVHSYDDYLATTTRRSIKTCAGGGVVRTNFRSFTRIY